MIWQLSVSLFCSRILVVQYCLCLCARMRKVAMRHCHSLNWAAASAASLCQYVHHIRIAKSSIRYAGKPVHYIAFTSVKR